MTTSISKGCFVSKPKGKNVKSDLFFENDQTVLYEKITGNIEKSLLEIHKEIQNNLFNELLSFIQKSHSDVDRIATALLMLGVNVSDHTLLFKQLSVHLSVVTPMIAVVSSKVCTSIRSMIQSIITQLIHTATDAPIESNASDMESDNEDADINLKKTHYDFPHFQDYYNETGCKNKLVIILEDYESFPCTLLNEFLLILHEYLATLPFVLICGVSTSPSIIHSTLNYDVISTMMIHTFNIQPSIEFLNLITDRIILKNEFPVLLHPSILEFLIDNFLFFDFSVHTFMKGVKICILKHLSLNDVNTLCHSVMNQTLSEKMITKPLLDEINKLDSVTKLKCKKLDPTSVVNYASKLYDSICNMYSAVQCLFALVHDLPNNPLGKQLRDIYCVVLSDNHFIEGSSFKQCLQLIQFISKQELLEKVENTTHILKQNANLNTILREVQKLEKEIESADTEVQIKQSSTTSKLDLKPKSRAQLKQNLLENIKQDKLQYEFDIKRDKFVQYLIANLFKQYLVPIQNIPLHEVVVFKDCHLLKKCLAGAPRAAIHTALNNPSYYFQCDCCKVNDPMEMLPSMPDVCLAYKLHLESSTNINMHDWLQSFGTIVNPDNKLSDAAVKARFTQAVSELQFLGFIKNCKQKIDHVSRLTWGDS
uniref:Origin recognition complex subunit 3 n=1 Tax=Cacopsylla melanoneura TaxID=428564 RepID=A0A8D8T2L7_9HEMI